MGRPKKKLLYPSITLTNYRKLLPYSFFHPFLYARTLSEFSGVTLSLEFFALNIAIGTLLKILLVIVLTQNITAAFLGISSLLFFLPISLGIFLLSTALFYILARLLGGKGSFGKTLFISSYALLPSIFFQIPLVSILAFLYYIFLLTLSFKEVQKYSWTKAVFTIVFPFIVLITLLVSIGVLNPFYLLSLNII